MKELRREFETLPENFQEKIFDLLVEKYTLQGKDNPTKRAWRKIKEQGRLTYRAWRRLHYFSMVSIDKALMEKGLPPQHFNNPVQREPSLSCENDKREQRV